MLASYLHHIEWQNSVTCTYLNGAQGMAEHLNFAMPILCPVSSGDMAQPPNVIWPKTPLELPGAHRASDWPSDQEWVRADDSMLLISDAFTAFCESGLPHLLQTRSSWENSTTSGHRNDQGQMTEARSRSRCLLCSNGGHNLCPYCQHQRSSNTCLCLTHTEKVYLQLGYILLNRTSSNRISLGLWSARTVLKFMISDTKSWASSDKNVSRLSITGAFG